MAPGALGAFGRKHRKKLEHEAGGEGRVKSLLSQPDLTPKLLHFGDCVGDGAVKTRANP